MTELKDSLEKLYKVHRESLEKLEEFILTQPHIPKNIRE